MSRPARNAKGPGAALIWDLLTFDKLMTGTVIHLIYWSGLGVIALLGFSVIGAAVGVALREESLLGVLLALPVLVGGLLVVGALVLLWRSFCEFYVAIFRLTDDLHALRLQAEEERGPPPPRA